MLLIAPHSPISPEGRALIAASQAAMLEVFRADEIFTMDPAELDRPHISFLVAQIDTPQGTQAVGCVAMVRCGDYAEVKRLFVEPAARGQGLARQLMAQLEDMARAEGLPTIRLETGDALRAAVALYTDMGYQVCGPFGDYAAHPASLFMEKSLIPTG